MSIRCRVARVDDLTATLSLPSADACASIIGIDDDYLVPIQIITAGQTNRFTKNAKYHAVGWLITLRVDQAESANTGSAKTNGESASPVAEASASGIAETVTVPVLIGTLVRDEPSAVSWRTSLTGRAGVMLAAIVVLTAAYLLVRMRIGRSRRRWGDRWATTQEGRSDADGTR